MNKYTKMIINVNKLLFQNVHKSLLVLFPVLFIFTAGCGSGTTDGRIGYSSVDNLQAEIIDEEEARVLSASLSARGQGLKSWRDLRPGLEKSLTYARQRPRNSYAVTLPGSAAGEGVYVTWGELCEGLSRMLEILPYLDVNPGLLASEFIWLRLSDPFGFTGYYEPTLKAGYKKSAKYKYPIYKMPPELKRGVKYHDRKSIDRDMVLAGRGLELAWIEDDVDIFFLQIQGSGRLIFPDGKSKHVLYAGKNGHPYVSLGRMLCENKLLDPDNVSMPSIRACLLDNPHRKIEMLDLNPSYVFFRLADDGPVGSMGSTLTPKVSLAVDPSVLAHGSLLFFNVSIPDKDGEHTNEVYHIGLPQDSGGAIKGRRIDVFFGAGDEAEHLAGHLNNSGEVYLLLPVKDGSYTYPLDSVSWKALQDK